MRLVFFGTSDFGIPGLKALREAGHQVLAAVTTREKPKGRGRKLAPSPIKTAAQELAIPVLEPDSPNVPEFVAQLTELKPEFIVLAAYRFILKPEVLAVPAKGCLNIHPSLLPRYRGAAPIQRAIIAGEPETGVSIFLMNEKIDQGDVVLQTAANIGENETYGELSKRLAELGAKLVVEALRHVGQDDLRRIPQDLSLASYAPKIGKEERLIDWHKPARQVHNLIRGLSPEPGAFTLFRGKRLEVLRSEVLPERNALPGELVVDDGALRAGAETGSVLLVLVKPEGSKAMSGIDLINGHRIKSGERLGETCESRRSGTERSVGHIENRGRKVCRTRSLGHAGRVCSCHPVDEFHPASLARPARLRGSSAGCNRDESRRCRPRAEVPWFRPGRSAQCGRYVVARGPGS